MAETAPSLDMTPEVMDLLDRALAEDIGSGDATTLALVPQGDRVGAALLARTPCVAAGMELALAVFRRVDAAVEGEILVRNGGRAAAGDTLLRLRGPGRALLTAERTALNFAQRLCGIATLTARFVERVAGTGAAILDTRKTTPGLRALEKHAVRCGGGSNHRFGLYDRILIKDNHRLLWGKGAAGSLAEAVREARGRYPGLQVEIEVENEPELADALRGRPDWVLLDNMPPDLMRRCVARCAGACRVEASGGIALENVLAAAQTGVDAISLGCLTHSAPAADLSLDIEA